VHISSIIDKTLGTLVKDPKEYSRIYRRAQDQQPQRTLKRETRCAAHL
jgi:hypothetical protein